MHETALLAGAALSGDLIGSLWDSAVALDNSGELTGLLNAIRSNGYRGAGRSSGSSGLEPFLSPAMTKLDPGTFEVDPSNRDAVARSLNDLSLLPPPTQRSVNDSPAVDPVTGLAEIAALSAPTFERKVNFQPENAPLPAGYSKDFGQAYDANRGYGWVRQGTSTPLDITANTRDRNRAGIDQRLDTLIHMQLPATNPAAWEYALANGRYSVTVSVGDKSPYDSTHKIRVEGVTAIKPFIGSSTAFREYELGTATVNIQDGKLTVDALGGTNTKLNYLEVESVSTGRHPKVTASSPTSRKTGVNRSAAVNLDVGLVTTAGVDPTTLTLDNVQLYRTRDNTLVPGSLNTTGGGDAIVYQPNDSLASNTNYTYRLGQGVTDTADKTFLPFSTTFTTGTTSVPLTPGIRFIKSQDYTVPSLSSLVTSPDGNKLYATALDGNLRRWTIGSDGTLTNLETFGGLAGSDPAGPRAIIGITFDPTNPNLLWVSHNDTIFSQPAPDFTGKISKLTLQSDANPTDGIFNASIQDYVVGLPRSAKDHLSNSLAFGPDGKLYMTQGSNSAMGAPDEAWYFRNERLLSGAVLQIAPRRTPSQPFNVQTEDYQGTTGSYNPYATGAPVKIYATGVRNAYDLVWHSNDSLYVPTNGSAAGGNTPDNPGTPANEGLTNVATQNDYLFKVEQRGYYGHPNPTRSEYIMNGGNPTSGLDPAEVVDQGTLYNGYGVGTEPESNYSGFTHDFGRNRSPNGAIEYQSDTLSGALQNQLLVVEYSGGDDILALKLDASGNVNGVNQVATDFDLENPLDLVEDHNTSIGRKGNLYVAELVDPATGQGRVTLFKQGPA